MRSIGINVRKWARFYPPPVIARGDKWRPLDPVASWDDVNVPSCSSGDFFQRGKQEAGQNSVGVGTALEGEIVGQRHGVFGRAPRKSSVCLAQLEEKSSHYYVWAYEDQENRITNLWLHLLSGGITERTGWRDRKRKKREVRLYAGYFSVTDSFCMRKRSARTQIHHCAHHSRCYYVSEPNDYQNWSWSIQYLRDHKRS